MVCFTFRFVGTDAWRDGSQALNVAWEASQAAKCLIGIAIDWDVKVHGWYGMAWLGMAWLGLAWHGMARGYNEEAMKRR
jgi:hypothetical protein